MTIAAPAPKSNRNRNIALAGLGLLLVCGGCAVVAPMLGLAGIAGVGNEMSRAATEEAGQPGGSRETAVEIGTPVEVDELTVTVTGATEETELSDTSGLMQPMTAGEGSKLVVVTYDVANGGKDMVTAFKFDIVDDQGREFSPVGITMGDYLPEGAEDCTAESINPGLSSSCGAIYEMPADASGLVARPANVLGMSAKYVDLGLGE